MGAPTEGPLRAAACVGEAVTQPAATSAIPSDHSPTLFKSAKAFETWLKKNHGNTDGLWLKIAKRGAR